MTRLEVSESSRKPAAPALARNASGRLAAAGLLVWSLSLALLPAGVAAGWTTPSADPPAELIADSDFEPRPEGHEGPDWIQLSSGEWLQGTVDRIRIDSLEFDSDELDDLKLDFGDVFAVLTAGPQTLRVEPKREVSGTVAIRGAVVRVRTASGIETYSRSDLVGMVPGMPTERNYWSGKASLGLTLRAGNTSQSDLTTVASLTRETARSRFDNRYNGTISNVNGVQTDNNHRVNTKGDIFITRRFYVTVLSFEYYTDLFQNVDFRFTPATGLGYAIVDSGRTEIDVAINVGATVTRDLVPPASATVTDHTSAAIIFRLDFDTDITNDIEWSGQYQVQMGVPETAETFHHALTTLSVDVWSSLDLDTTFIWDRNQAATYRPLPSSPFPDDYRLTIGFGWDF